MQMKVLAASLPRFSDGQNDLLGFCVHRGKAVVEMSNGGFPQKCAGDGDALLLPAAEVDTAFCQNCFVVSFRTLRCCGRTCSTAAPWTDAKSAPSSASPKAMLPAMESETRTRPAERSPSSGEKRQFHVVGQRLPVEFNLSERRSTMRIAMMVDCRCRYVR